MNAWKRTWSRWHCGIADGGAAQAQISDNVIKIGVLTDMSSLYTTWRRRFGAAAKDGGRRLGIEKRGYKVEVISADHTEQARCRLVHRAAVYDVDKVDVIVDTPNFGVALAVNQITRDTSKAFLVSVPRRRSHRQGVLAQHRALDLRHVDARQRTGGAIVKTGGDTWFFLTADYAFGRRWSGDTEAVVLKKRRQGARQRSGIRSTRRISRRSCCSAGVEAKIVGLANAGGDTTNSINRRPNSASSKAARIWRDCSCS